MKIRSIIVPSHEADFVELADSRSGRLFRKHILTKGPLIHPKTKTTVQIDDDFVQRIKDNFVAGVCPIVQVPLAGAHNEHTEDPDRNIGHVIGLEEKDDKVFAIFSADDEVRADKLGKTLLGASALLNLDYTDTRTGKKVGPTLLHMAVTNRPYLTDLDPYEEIVAASADSEGETVLLTAAVGDNAETEGRTMTLDELVAELKLSHGVDVPALQAAAEEGESATAVVAALSAALSDSGMLALSAGETNTAENVIGAITDLVDENVRLTHDAAEAEIDALVGEARILPAQKDGYLKLKLSNPELFEEMLPEKPLVELSGESGTSGNGTSAHEFDIDAEVDRIIAQSQA